MPETTTKDIEELRAFKAAQDVRNMKVDMILETLSKQSVSFELALTQFQQVVTDNKIAITRVQDKATVTERVISVVGGLLILIAGSIIGQFIHFKPF